MTLKFVDTSHWNGTYTPHGPVVAKATEGVNYVDPQYAATKAACAKGHYVFGGYHFLDPGNILAQARHAFSVIGKSTGAMADVERSSGGSVSLAETFDFIDEYHRLGGIMEVAYVPRWYWSSVWGSPSLLGFPKRNVKIVTSDYTTYSDTGPGWTPYGGLKASDIAWWQYTDKPVDGDAFKGTAAQLGELLLPTKPTTPVYVHPAGSRTLILQTPNMDGHDVVVVQNLLKVHADGKYGPDTVSVVKRWQTTNKLTVDGKFGPQCWTRIGVKYTGK